MILGVNKSNIMTPKEKAKELYDKFRILNFGNSAYKTISKQCALIAVDEIIKDQNGNDATVGNKSWWWKEVKQEIENL